MCAEATLRAQKQRGPQIWDPLALLTYYIPITVPEPLLVQVQPLQLEPPLPVLPVGTLLPVGKLHTLSLACNKRPDTLLPSLADHSKKP